MSPEASNDGSAKTVVEVAPGIWSIALPTPWPVGPVNVHLVEDDPLTLVDTGQSDAPALAALEAGLAAGGRWVEDVERIVVSHQHIDHWGLAQLIADRSGAELCALEGFAEWMAAYPRALEQEDAYADGLLRRHGAADRAAGAAVYRGDEDYGLPARVTRVLRHGDVLEFAQRRLHVLHRPGHSPSDTVLHDERRGILFGADHVLARPSTAIPSPALDGATAAERPHALAQYMTSLRETEALDLQVILTGHGGPVRDHRAVIGERLRGYERMTERVAGAVREEPRTAVEIASDLRGPIPDGTLFFALCDILGHLDRLVDAGRAVEHAGPDGVARFATGA